jgi:SOS-response transcriptional repressor LexA
VVFTGVSGSGKSSLAFSTVYASRSVARKHVLALTEAGFIEVNPNQARGIRLLNQPMRPQWLDVPVLGRVAAGSPIGADAEVHSRLQLDPSTFAKTPDYLLRVQGDSMIEDGILDGDLVGVRRSAEALRGQHNTAPQLPERRHCSTAHRASRSSAWITESKRRSTPAFCQAWGYGV